MLSLSYPILFYIEINKLILNLHRKVGGPEQTKWPWKKIRVGGEDEQFPISNKKCVSCIKDSQINQWNRIKSPEINPYING